MTGDHAVVDVETKAPAIAAAEAALAEAAAAEAAASVALVTVLAATATVCARAGTKRVRWPPLASPVLGLLSSVTVEPSPPTEVANVTLLTR